MFAVSPLSHLSISLLLSLFPLSLLLSYSPIRYAHKNGCFWDDRTCSSAAMKGHLDCLKYPSFFCHYYFFYFFLLYFIKLDMHMKMAVIGIQAQCFMQ
jgi:hypothetical protein